MSFGRDAARRAHLIPKRACREERASHEPRSDSRILVGGAGLETRSPIRLSGHAACRKMLLTGLRARFKLQPRVYACYPIQLITILIYFPHPPPPPPPLHTPTRQPLRRSALALCAMQCVAKISSSVARHLATGSTIISPESSRKTRLPSVCLSTRSSRFLRPCTGAPGGDRQPNGGVPGRRRRAGGPRVRGRRGRAVERRKLPGQLLVADVDLGAEHHQQHHHLLALLLGLAQHLLRGSWESSRPAVVKRV